MIIRNNHTLIEVACAIKFKPDLNEWDSTYFGKFYDKIQVLGFNEKQEKKVFEVKIEDSSENGGIPKSETHISDVQMIFQNSNKNSAIILSSNFISFNQLHPYKNWSDLIENIATPALTFYNEIGLGKGIIQVQALYLNKFTLNLDDKISNYLAFLPQLSSFQFEKNLNYQTHFQITENIEILLKVNSVPNKDTSFKDVFFEISCYVKSEGSENDFKELADIAHSKVNNIFEELIKND